MSKQTSGECGVFLPEQRAADGNFYGPRYRRVAWRMDSDKLTLIKVWDWYNDESWNFLPYYSPEDVESIKQQVMDKMTEA